MADAMLKLEGVHKRFGELEVLRGVDLDVSRGQVVCVLGPSGSGKSTLLRCINLLEPPDAGRILVEGKEITGDSGAEDIDFVRQRVGMVFQQFNLFPHMTVQDNITLAPMKVRNWSRDKAEAKAKELLQRVGIPEQAKKYPGQLSGGQQQRVAIARALVNHPSLILADEPTGNLDSRTSIEIMGIFQQLNRQQGMTLIYVTHEHDIAEYAKRVIVFRDGRIIYDAPVAAPRDAAEELRRLSATTAEQERRAA